MWPDSGAQCVITSGPTKMLQWCVDNLVTMEVSLSEQGLRLLLILCF